MEKSAPSRRAGRGVLGWREGTPRAKTPGEGLTGDSGDSAPRWAGRPRPGPLTCSQWRWPRTGCRPAPPAFVRTAPAPRSSPWARPRPPHTCDAQRPSCWRWLVTSLGAARRACLPGACAYRVVSFELRTPGREGYALGYHVPRMCFSY